MTAINLLDAIEGVLRSQVLETGPIRLMEPQCPEFEQVEITRKGRAVIVRPDAVSLKECPRQDCPISYATQDRLFPLFRIQETDLTRSCDRIIFYQPRLDSPLYVFLIELKQGGKGGRRQLQNSRVLADYILSVTRLHHHGRLVSFPDICYRAIVFTPKAKTPGRRCPYVAGDGPFPDIKYVHLQNSKYTIDYFCDAP